MPLCIRCGQPCPTILTSGERAVLRLLLLGCSPRAIATRIGRSIKTIETHLGHIRQKYQQRNLYELIAYGHRHHLLPLLGGGTSAEAPPIYLVL